MPPSIYIIDKLEDVCFPYFSLGLYYLGDIYMHVKLNVVLIKGQDEVHLECVPFIDDVQE